MATPDKDPIERLGELAESVDRQFAGIQTRNSRCMECRSGCSDCCRARLSISRIEESLLRRGLEQMPEVDRQEMARAAVDPTRETCPALDPLGRCRLYRWRPLICRSFGVPLRRTREVPLVNPPVIDSCDKNFIDTPLAVLPARDVFDQTGLEAEVDVLDDEYCRQRGLPPRVRVPIAGILAAERDLPRLPREP